MATIKINYGGTTYSMVKTSSKITTPSAAVDGGWIPCFKGDRFAEVKSGDRIYTLSPLMINGYRMACGSRSAYTTDAYVTASCNIAGGKANGVFIYEVGIDWSFSNSSGATVTVSNTNMYGNNSPFAPQDTDFGEFGGPIFFTYTWSKTFTGNVTVKAGDVVLKQQNFSFTISLTVAGFGANPSTQKIQIA